jgi:hypothetical protein
MCIFCKVSCCCCFMPAKIAGDPNKQTEKAKTIVNEEKCIREIANELESTFFDDEGGMYVIEKSKIIEIFSKHEMPITSPNKLYELLKRLDEKKIKTTYDTACIQWLIYDVCSDLECYKQITGLERLYRVDEINSDIEDNERRWNQDNMIVKKINKTAEFGITKCVKYKSKGEMEGQEPNLYWRSFLSKLKPALTSKDESYGIETKAESEPQPSPVLSMNFLVAASATASVPNAIPNSSPLASIRQILNAKATGVGTGEVAAKSQKLEGSRQKNVSVGFLTEPLGKGKRKTTQVVQVQQRLVASLPGAANTATTTKKSVTSTVTMTRLS